VTTAAASYFQGTGTHWNRGRVPIEFLEIELGILQEMGLHHDQTPECPAANGRTRLERVC